MIKNRLILFIFLFTTAISFGLAQENFVKIKVNNSPDSIAYLGYHFADKRFVQDTVSVVEDLAIFKSTEPWKPGLYFYYTPNVYFEFIVNEAEVSIETKGENYSANMIVLESEENKIFTQMQAFVSSKRSDYNNLNKKIEESPEDSSKVLKLRSQMTEIDEEVKAFQNNLAAENQGTFASRMILAMQKPEIPDSLIGDGEELLAKRYNYFRDHFFDGVEIGDAGLLRTPIFNQKVVEYFDNVIVQIPDTVIKEVDWFLSEAKMDAEVYRYALVTLTSKYETSPIMGMDEVFVHIVENYYLKGSADWVDSETRDKLAERIATMKPNFLGNQAPPLSLNDTIFSSIRLYDINADFTVLYFYDPDCGHCKKKSPVLYEAYTKLRNRNVEVLAICITTDTDRWKEYIRENNFDWINLADSSGKSNFRYYYDIRSTPVIYILDKDKKIVAKKLDATQVESFITQMQDLQSRSN